MRSEGQNGRPEEGESRPSGMLAGLFDLLRTMTGRKNGDANSLRAALEELLEENDEDTRTLTDDERTLLLNALSFGELEVRDVMVPRTDVKGIDITSDLDEVIGAMRDAMHTRMPVYRETLDDVVGMAHIKDMLRFWGDGETFALTDVIRKVLYVPPSMRVLDLLFQMRDTQSHMAIVVDEYGGTDGLATIEDLVEEIVGEIQDEHDRIIPPQMTGGPEDSLDVDARMPVEDVEERLGLNLIDDERRDNADTMGGLVSMLLDRVPARGEIFHHPAGVDVEVLDADARRVKRLRLRSTKSETKAGAS
ncbi:MAG: hemolysin family protein [Geminicoccaceae bacterium]